MHSSLKLKTITPILKEDQTKLFTLWQSLQDHNDSLFFRTPVDKNGTPLLKQPSRIIICMSNIQWTSVPSSVVCEKVSTSQWRKFWMTYS